MKHFNFPAAAFIGWIRIARPGSILGPQQHFMLEKESEFLPSGSLNGRMKKMNIGEMSPEDKRKSVYGDLKQGDDLVGRKYANPSFHVRR